MATAPQTPQPDRASVPRFGPETAKQDGKVPADTAHDLHDARFQVFWVLRIGFAVLPILMGADKFAKVMNNDWPQYLAHWINSIFQVSGQTFMYAVGAIEILAGILVLLKPRYFAWVVAGWLVGIIVSLLTLSGFYDVALRDFGLLLAAIGLARLASVYDRPWKGLP